MSRYRAPVPASSPYITAAGRQRLEQELSQIWQRRGVVTRALSAAAAEGDRSENAEYIYRKKELREIDRRIRYLQKRIPVLQVIDRHPTDPERIYFNARVTLKDANDAEYEYRIVGADELDAGTGHISIDAPLARALLKHRVGDEVQLQTPQGELSYIVLAIRYVD